MTPRLYFNLKSELHGSKRRIKVLEEEMAALRGCETFHSPQELINDLDILTKRFNSHTQGNRNDQSNIIKQIRDLRAELRDYIAATDGRMHTLAAKVDVLEVDRFCCENEDPFCNPCCPPLNTPNAGATWDEEDAEVLDEMYKKFKYWTAKRLGRSSYAVHCRVKAIMRGKVEGGDAMRE